MKSFVCPSNRWWISKLGHSCNEILSDKTEWAADTFSMDRCQRLAEQKKLGAKEYIIYVSMNLQWNSRSGRSNLWCDRAGTDWDWVWGKALGWQKCS